MARKYKVSFEIEGEMICDDTELSTRNLKEQLKGTFDVRYGQDYETNRDIDTKIKKLKITEVS